MLNNRMTLKIFNVKVFLKCYGFKNSQKTCFNPLDTGRKLNVQKTFRRHPERLLN